MRHSKCDLMLTALVCVVLFTPNCFAEENDSGRFPGNSSSNADDLLTSSLKNLDASFTLRIDEKVPLNRDIDFSSAQYNYFKFKGKKSTETDPFDTSSTEEFENLSWENEGSVEAESMLEYYSRKFMLKGEYTFSGNGSSARETDDGLVNQVGTPKKRLLKPNFLSRLFSPGQLKWGLEPDFDDRSLTAEVYLGNHFVFEGNVGEKNDVLMSVKIPF